METLIKQNIIIIIKSYFSRKFCIQYKIFKEAHGIDQLAR